MGHIAANSARAPPMFAKKPTKNAKEPKLITVFLSPMLILYSYRPCPSAVKPLK